MAIGLIESGQYEEAITYAEMAVRHYPFILTYNTLGVAYYNYGYYQKSKEAYLNALNYGDYYVIYNQLALLAVVLENDSHLNSNFIKDSIKKFPKNYILWLYLAIYDYENNNIESAKMAIINAKNLSNNNPIVIDGYDKIMNGEPLNLQFAPEKK